MPLSFHSSVSKVGSHEPTEAAVRSTIFQLPLLISVVIAAEALLTLSSSLKIKVVERFSPFCHVIICGLEIGIALVPPPLKLKAVLQKTRVLLVL